ncbi:MAG: chemotaxis protein CheX [Lachnospiraceae bacterium]|nr:chemotaxis protein CheX [Lachnospiraceae bacterium]
MFDQVFGNYLVNTGYLSEEEFKDVLADKDKARVKLGVIAVTEKLMSSEQADEVNRLQAMMDKRFGDIAIEKGYLTDDQVGRLLKKQGNSYMIFVQTLLDKNLMSLDEVDTMLKHFQSVEGFSDSEMDDLVSGDVDRTIALYLPDSDELGTKHCGIAIRTFLRLIDSEAYVSKAHAVSEVKVDNFAFQTLVGNPKIHAGFAGEDKALLNIAGPFGEEDFETVDLDALDAVGEFINCINGMFASDVSNNGIDVDMMPPEFHETPCRISGDKLIIFPIHSKEQTIYFLLSIDSDWKVEDLAEE